MKPLSLLKTAGAGALRNASRYPQTPRTRRARANGRVGGGGGGGWGRRIEK